MLAIRLQRVGKAKHPTYRLIISEKGRTTRNAYLELLGTFNPHLKENQFQPKVDRVKYWLSKGAEASPTVHNLLLKMGLVQGKTMKSVFLSKKRKTKLAEKKGAAQTAAVAAAEKKAAAQAAVPVVEEKTEEAPAPVEKPVEAVTAPVEEKPAEVTAPVEEKPAETPVVS